MPRHVRTHAVSASILLALALPALAQPGTQSTLLVTGNGLTSATVQVGEPVRLSVVIQHNGLSVAGFQGRVEITSNAGTPSNFTTQIPSLPTVVMGSFEGGSRTGIDVAFTPPGFVGGPIFPSAMNPMPVLEYDLTFDHWGEYAVNWIPSIEARNVRLYSSITPAPNPAPTTYLGALITVVPSPASASLLLFAAAARRRRRAS